MLDNTYFIPQKAIQKHFGKKCWKKAAEAFVEL
jgi:hypothetical protein